MDNKKRTSENKRDAELEDILTLLNDTLTDDEIELTQKFESPRHPVLFIVGNARSGTTLLYQWLAATDHFGYPSNIISRFYKAPYIGALIHKIFVDHDKFGELLGDQTFNFQSNLGKTKSPVSPHEFWYFWRRFFEFGEIQKLSVEELKKIDYATFVRELAALESAFKKPLVLKGMILNWNLEFIKSILPNAIFIHLKRNEVFNMQSLYKARMKYFGDANKWYSFKPPEYKKLKNEPIYNQLAGQVVYTNQAISKQLNRIDTTDHLEINYENLCDNPSQIYSEINTLLKEKGINIDSNYAGPKNFVNKNRSKVEEFDFEKATKAIDLIIS